MMRRFLRNRYFSFFLVILLCSSTSSWALETPMRSSESLSDLNGQAKPIGGPVRFALQFVGNYARTVSLAELDGKTVRVAGGPQPGFGLGLGIEFRFSGLFSIESGGIWERREQNLAGLVVRAQYFQIPLMARLHPLSWFSFGAGGYYGYRVTEPLRVGDFTLVSADEPGLVRSRHDLGLVVSVRTDAALGARWGLFVEGRATLGLMSVDPLPGVRENWESAQLLLGIAWQ